MQAVLINTVYLIASVLFILGLKGLTHPRTAVRGNLLGALGMFSAVVATLLKEQILPVEYILIGAIIGALIGVVLALKIPMTSMPELVAVFNGLGGGASVLVAGAALVEQSAPSNQFTVSTAASGLIGAVTFWGSIVAFFKLMELLKGLVQFPGQQIFNGLLTLVTVGLGAWLVLEPGQVNTFWIMVGVASVLGVLLVVPIGGADMPVVIALLNSCSGLAAAATGFVLENTVLIIAGSLVGASGLILTQIMCRAMNRSFFSVILGGFGGEAAVATTGGGDKSATAGSAEDAAFIMKNAGSVIIVPGYGMAVAQAQHALREMADKLKEEGVQARYAIHPVAGRMPGHMNVLLAEANVPYDEVAELEAINSDFATTDVAFVIGANDVTNPAARDDPGSPIYGMPILDVDKAQTVLFVKRSLSPGYAGIDNDLFYQDNTMILFADAKQLIEDVVKAL